MHTNTTKTYCIAGKFGEEFNLADWRICERTAPIFHDNIWWVGSGNFSRPVSEYECEASFEDGVVQILYQREPDIPYESSLAFRQTSRKKKNAEVKHALEEDTSVCSKYNEYTPEERALFEVDHLKSALFR